MLPLARPGLAAVAVIQFLYVWNEYLLALVMFNTDALMPVQRGLTKFVSSDTPEQHILLAATAMAVLPVIILYAVAQRASSRASWTARSRDRASARPDGWR